MKALRIRQQKNVSLDDYSSAWSYDTTDSDYITNASGKNTSAFLFTGYYAGTDISKDISITLKLFKSDGTVFAYATKRIYIKQSTSE